MEDSKLIRAYIAGAIDSGSTISASINKDESLTVGYGITPVIAVRRHRPELPDFLAFWGQNIGIQSELRQEGEGYRWTVQSRDDIQEVLERIKPYLMIYDEAAEIMLEELIPRLREKRHTTKEGFIQTMTYVDEIRERTVRKSWSEYDREYFEALWSEDA